MNYYNDDFSDEDNEIVYESDFEKEHCIGSHCMSSKSNNTTSNNAIPLPSININECDLPQVDELAAREWYYPTNYTIREYQMNIVKQGKLHHY